MMKYLETDTLKGYDVLLDQYEEGASMALYDEFFKVLKEDLVPFVLKIASLPLDVKNTLENKTFSLEKQEKLRLKFRQELITDKE